MLMRGYWSTIREWSSNKKLALRDSKISDKTSCQIVTQNKPSLREWRDSGYKNPDGDRLTRTPSEAGLDSWLPVEFLEDDNKLPSPAESCRSGVNLANALWACVQPEAMNACETLRGIVQHVVFASQVTDAGPECFAKVTEAGPECFQQIVFAESEEPTEEELRMRYAEH